jgi:hypothetical protein
MTILWALPVESKQASISPWSHFGEALEAFAYNGIRKVGFVSLGSIDVERFRPDEPWLDEEGRVILDPIADAAVRDAYGRVVFTQPPSEYVERDFYPKGTVAASINNPRYLKYLETSARTLIDFGADVIYFDGFYAWPMNCGYGDYSNCSKLLFKDYLRGKYNASQLLDMFQIENIDCFDIAKYVVERGYYNVSSAYRCYDDKLWREYLTFQADYSAHQMVSLVNRVKNYALSKYGRSVPVMVMAFFNQPAEVYASAEADILSYESLIRIGTEHEPGDYERPWREKQMSTYLTMYYMMGMKPVMSFPTLSFVRYVYEKYGPIMPRNMTRLLMYEAIASRSSFSAGFPMEYGYFYNLSSPDEIVREVNSFILQNSALYSYDDEIRPLSDIAVVSPTRSLMYYWTPIDARAQCMATDRRIVMEALTDLHIPAVVIREDDIHLDILRRYRAVVLPSIAMLSDDEIEAIEEYVREGGGLVVTGETAIAHENFTRREDYGLSFLTNAHLGTEPLLQYSTFGDGKVAYLRGSGRNLEELTGLLGDYLNNVQRGLRPDRQLEVLQSIFDYVLGGEHLLDTNASSRVGITVFRKGDDSLLAHLVNYDYEEETDFMNCQANILVRLRVPPGFSMEGKTIRVLSPDESSDCVTLAYTFKEGILEFVVPRLFVYDVIVISDPTRDVAEQAIMFARDALARIGACQPNQAEPLKTLSLSLEAYRSGRNLEAERLAWRAIATAYMEAAAQEYRQAYFRTNRVESCAVASSLIGSASALSSGNLARAVALAKSAYEGASRLAPTKILFDESHGEAFSISRRRAEEITNSSIRVFGDVEHNSFASFADILRILGNTVESFEGGTISLDLLRNYDVLVMAHPTSPYSSSELQAIQNFVAEGGGLFLARARIDPTQAQNDVARLFGAEFLPGTVMSSKVDWYERDIYWWGAVFMIHNVNTSAHPIVRFQPEIYVHWGCALKVSDDWAILARTPSYTWLDSLPWNFAQDGGEPQGPLDFLAVRPWGKGRIVALSNIADFLHWGTPLAYAAVRWLSESKMTVAYAAFQTLEEDINRTLSILREPVDASFKSPKSRGLISNASVLFSLSTRAFEELDYGSARFYLDKVGALIEEAQGSEVRYNELRVRLTEVGETLAMTNFSRLESSEARALLAGALAEYSNAQLDLDSGNYDESESHVGACSELVQKALVAEEEYARLQGYIRVMAVTAAVAIVAVIAILLRKLRGTPT